MRRSPIPAVVTLLGVLLAPISPASARILLNEIDVKGSPESFEVFNDSTAAVDITGWIIEADGGQDTLSGVVPAGDVLQLFNTNAAFLDCGIEILLLNDVGAGVDFVAYGDRGPAPTPSATDSTPATLTRWEDGIDTGDLANDWTMDFSPTLGASNMAPMPMLARDVRINEVKKGSLGPSRSGPGDQVELFNPTPGFINLNGWFLSDGDALITLSGNIAPFGFQVFTVSPQLNLEANDVLYLFDQQEIRVDQLGVQGTPGTFTAADDLCLAKLPDGAGPPNGFDFPTSGGGIELFQVLCTLGGPNQPVTAAGGGGRSVPSTWGRVKGTFPGP